MSFFVNAKTLVQDAFANGYAVPALNTNGGNYDIARAALEAAQELKSPLILQVYEPNCQYRGFKYFVQMAEFLCDEMDIRIPVALQLDHGHSFDSVLNAMAAGFTSVMFDASHKPLAENIKATQKVVEVAQSLGVSVEAEIGYVKGNEPTEERQVGRIPVPQHPTIPPAKTDINEAIEFSQKVDIDMLAVSVGTTHGVYEEQNNIDYALLAELREKLDVPLVQHGTCGISLDTLEKLSRGGMSKINFGEPFRFNYIKYFNQLIDEMEHLWHPWKIMSKVKDMLKEDMKALISALGSDGRG